MLSQLGTLRPAEGSYDRVAEAPGQDDQGMTATPATTNTVLEPGAFPGNLCAEVRETHTGVVVLLGDKAYKAKKPVVTDFLDFSTPERRERACVREFVLNSRLSPDSYLGIAHLQRSAGRSGRAGDRDAPLLRIPAAWPRW